MGYSAVVGTQATGLVRGGTISNKEAVLEIVRTMSEEATLEEIVEEIQILAAIRRGEEAVREGRIVSHEDLKLRLASWLSKSSGPSRCEETGRWTPGTRRIQGSLSSSRVEER
jgi:predicted transcriptional regulator